MVSVGPHHEAEKAAPVLRLVCLEHESSRAVPEDDCAVPLSSPPRERLRRNRTLGVSEHDRPLRVAPRVKRCVALRADEEHAPIRPGSDEGVGDVQPGEEPGALHANVESVRRIEPEPFRQEPAVAGEVVVGSHGREDNEVEFGRFETRAGQRALCGFVAQVGRRRSLSGVAPLLDACALPDPLVARVHQARDALVGDDSFRDEHSG